MTGYGHWCKFCNTHVRDSAIERKNHDSSIKHQNNIQKSLRTLHKKKEIEDRDARRTKDELARINGIVDGKHKATSGIAKAPRVSAPVKVSNAGPVGQGVYPQTGNIGMAGAWVATSTRIITPLVEDPDDNEFKREGSASEEKHAEIKQESSLSESKKRRISNVEETSQPVRPKKSWGTELKSYPDTTDSIDDLDALLKESAKPTVEDSAAVQADAANIPLKRSDSHEDADRKSVVSALPDATPSMPSAVVFKKRKAPKR